MKKLLIPFIFIVIIILTVLILNNKHTKEIDTLNKSHVIHNKTLAEEAKLTAGILQLNKKELLLINKNIKQYKQKQLNHFISERKKDLLFLSRIKLRQKLITSFYHTHKLNKKSIFKEVVYFNKRGKEVYKKSSIEAMKMDISKKRNTFCKKETYFKKIKNLNEGQIHISKIIHCKNGSSIIRLVTPIVRKFKKIGYLSVAIDYSHIEDINKDIQNIKNIKKGTK